MSGIHLGEDFIPYQEIVSHNFSGSHYLQQALSFCRDYLSGKSKFSVITSGSTGPPKPIHLTRKQLQSSATKTIQVLELQPHYQALVCISVDHIGGKMMLVRGMELGMELYLTEPKAKLGFKSLPQIDFMALVPMQLTYLTQSEAGKAFLENCKVTIIGGAGIGTKLEETLDRYPNPIYHTFGMTETASHFALRRLNGPRKQQHYQVLPGVHMSTDHRGCLVVKGDITNNKKLITNDLVSIIDKTTFRWLGRLDRVINTGAYKVHPESLKVKIQELLTSMEIAADHLLTSLPHPKWDQQVVLVLETQPLSESLELDLYARLKNQLHPYEVPKQIQYLDSFPRTDSGKVDFPQLKKIMTRH